MKEERRILLFNSFFNIIISIIKLIGGTFFHVHALFSDSIYTFCDAITDMIALMGSIIAGRRPTKYHPYGFGRVEYITNLFIGVLLFLVGMLLFTQSFHVSGEDVSLLVLGFVFLALFIKIFLFVMMSRRNKRLKSHVLEENIVEAKLDLLSTSLIAIVILLLQFSEQYPILRYGDVLASLFVCFLIFKASFALLKNNILNLLGEIECDKTVLEEVEEHVKKVPKVEVEKLELIKYGRYYKAHLIITLPKSTSLKIAKEIQKEVVSRLKKDRKNKIKIVNVELDIR